MQCTRFDNYNWYQTQALTIWCPARFCMVSDQHRRVLYPTLFDKRAGVFYVLWDDSPNTRDQRLYMILHTSALLARA